MVAPSPQLTIRLFLPTPRPCRPPSNRPYDYLPRRFPPPRSEDCPIHPPPAPDCFFPWWSRPPVDHQHYFPPPRPCRPPSNTPCDKVPRRSPPPRSADCPIHPKPAPGWFYRWWYRHPVDQNDFSHRQVRAVPLQIHRVIRPAEIPTTPLSGLPDPSTTCTGLVLWVVVPSPSWP